MNTVAMNNLWTYLQGLSLTAKNKKWLSERLLEPVRASVKMADADDSVMTDEEVWEGMKTGFQEMKLIKNGKLKARDAWEFMNDL